MASVLEVARRTTEIVERSEAELTAALYKDGQDFLAEEKEAQVGGELPATELAHAFLADYEDFVESENGRCGTCNGNGWAVPEGGRSEVRCHSCRGTGHVPTVGDWAEAGVTDPEAVASLRSGEYRPEDFSSRDPDLRLGAHSAAGIMVLDGELISNALALHRHDKRIDSRRCYQQRSEIVVDGQKVRWLSLSAEEQCEHISGYAAGVAEGPRTDGGRWPPDASPLFASGYNQGRETELTAQMVDRGDVASTCPLEVVDASGRLSMARDLKPMDAMKGYYTGFLAPTPLRPYEQKAMIARDAIVGFLA